MIILGIETSCDETAAALVKNGSLVISSMVVSSEKIHTKFGGIMPEKAAREQINCIIPVIQKTFKKSLLLKPISSINAISVTIGPGLIGSLLVGIETAKTLSYILKKPIIPINHLIAHIYANFLFNHKAKPKFPALCLIASGGHTELVLMKNHDKFQLLGNTRDDAAGECFDKCSRLLNLGYPGGPAIEKIAKTVKQAKMILPRPMINSKNLDFSFSGLKTAVLNIIRTKKYKQEVIASEVQEAITDVLVAKTIKAAKIFNINSILLGGGVTANQRLRQKLRLEINKNKVKRVRLFIPDKKLSTDNAVNIAIAAFYNYKPIPWQKIKPNPSLEIV